MRNFLNKLCQRFAFDNNLFKKLYAKERKVKKKVKKTKQNLVKYSHIW